MDGPGDVTRRPELPGSEGPQLSAVRYAPPENVTAFPFSVPAVACLEVLDFDAPVTLFVGENGSGKSTLLEALALMAGVPAVGADPLDRDPTLEAQRTLARCLHPTWRGRTHRGFFLRAEDFFGFQKALARERAGEQAELVRVAREMAHHSELGKAKAREPHAKALADMERRYGANPDARSHGEAFLRLFGSRLAPGGLYLLDEPEAALSPQSQLGFLAMMKDAVDAGSQFVIATHSPVLMAIPGATILSFDQVPVRAVRFEDLESVRLVRDFLQAPARYLRHVWGV